MQRATQTIPAAFSKQHVPLEGAFNFRDLGGYPTQSGRRVRTGQLYRADDLFRLSRSDLIELELRQLRLVIDLRTNEEAARRGSFAQHDHVAQYLRIPLMDISVRNEASDLPESYLEDRYREILLDAGPQFAHIITRILQEDALPAVFHCAVGKDRTGLLAMLVLGLLGVNDADIVADYSLTTVATATMLSWLRANHPELAASVEAIPQVLISSEPQTMQATLQWLRQTFGSFESYAGFIGITQREVSELRRRLLD